MIRPFRSPGSFSSLRARHGDRGPRKSRRLSRAPLMLEQLEERTLLACSISATKVDALVVDNDSDTKADPGDTLEYTVVISNGGGSDCTGVSFSDTEDPNTTLVPGSVMTTPIARNDSYSATGNVSITIAAGTGLLVNDNDADGVGPAL